ncbi:hypothetical protein ABH935_006431 [Catenulispora sp. GAS73]|uniref:hypothetical protein n=1 Tax=Catenulispora sp. GAS73 TaxID=3156269 RepID=UPI00351799AD
MFLDRIDRPGLVMAGRIARLTRAAYTGSDPLPGLPEPDGARDSAASVLAFAAGGGTIWSAVGGDGKLVATLRTSTPARADGESFISRVAAVRTGAGRWLLGAVERQLAAQGISRVLLDAVVERCLPDYYARLGYRPVELHLAVDDKMLTEVSMERDPRTTRRPAPPWTGAPDGTAEHAGTLCWFLDASGMIAVPGPARRLLRTAAAEAANLLDGSGVLIGMDIWRGPVDAFDEVLCRLPGARACGGRRAYRFTGGRPDVAAHLMPRAHHRQLWAALRYRPGREPQAVPWLHSPQDQAGADEE